MKKTIKTFALYKQEGAREFPEDTWNVSCEVSNESELLSFMKDTMRASARSFSNFPFGGMFHPSSLSFYAKTIIDDNGEIFTGKRVEITAPDYFAPASEKFSKYYEQLKIRLPKLEEARKKREKELADKCEYERLKNKFETI